MIRLRFRLIVLFGFLNVGLLGVFALAAPQTHAATTTYTIPGNTVFPEGIAYDPSTDYMYVGSTTDGTIFRGKTTDTRLSVFLTPGSDGRTSVTGMKVDSKGRLFVSGAATGFLFVYDTKTGTLIKKFDTGSEPKTFINDVALTPGGDAYFTDSTSPFLYKIAVDAAGTLTYSKYLDFTGTAIVYGQGFNLNGIVATADGKYLIVTQSNTGKIFRITIADKSIAAIDLGGDELAGDGLLLGGQTLYAVRTIPGNSSGAREMVSFTLSADFTTATKFTTYTDPAFAYPTTFAAAGTQFMVVNSQFDKRGPNLTPVLPFTIASIPVSALQTAPTTTTPGTPTSPVAATATPAPTATVAATATGMPTATPAVPGLPNTGAGGQDGSSASVVPLAAFAILLALLLLAASLFAARLRRKVR